MTDTKQPEALMLADLLDANASGGNVTTVDDERAIAQTLRRLHAENTTLQQGYDSARLEIESLKARLGPAGEYPPLPEPLVLEQGYDPGDMPDAYTAEQMRAYVDADRAMRAQAAPTPSGVIPGIGPVLDAATAGELAFYDYAVAQHCHATLRILDGTDGGAGANNEPWATVRRRLLELVASKAAPAAVAGSTPDGLLGDDGENRAVRMFLAAYGTPGLTVATMRRHMELAGWTQSPEWTTKPDAQGHLTKSGAQSWLRHLFALEAAAPTTQSTPTQAPPLSGVLFWRKP